MLLAPYSLQSLLPQPSGAEGAGLGSGLPGLQSQSISAVEGPQRPSAYAQHFRWGSGIQGRR